MHRFILASSLVVLAACGFSVADEVQLTPRNPTVKPEKTTITTAHRRDAISVKMRDDLKIRAIAGSLDDSVTGELNQKAREFLTQFPGGRWEPTHRLGSQKLEQYRQNAQNSLRRAVADLRTQFTYFVPDGANVDALIDELNKLDIVEIALPMPRPVELPIVPNFQPNQGYLAAATAGIGATPTWNIPYSSIGVGVKIADVEYSWNFNHQDLPPPILVGPAPIDPFNSTNHGTAVLGQLSSLNNGWGTTGIAHGSGSVYVAAANTAFGYDVGVGIINAMSALDAGDAMVIEQQTVGPNYTGVPSGTQFGLVPVEWYQPWYDAIVTAVGNGIIVVEAAGNGSQDLDAAVYSTGNGGHWPFLAANDSGAIIVGAGGAPTGASGDRSRLSFSNWGSTVDLQGWGERVYTTGYGTAYSGEGVNLYYASGFSGTSSASPIVTGACVLLQSYAKINGNLTLTPSQIKSRLVSTGSPQLSGAFPVSQKIGPRPNVVAAINTLDFDGPTPNPVGFIAQPSPVSPSSVTMTSQIATDSQSPSITYFFESDDAFAGGHDSGWIASTTYVDTGLLANTQYGYSVRARDSADPPNEGGGSGNFYTATMIETPTGVNPSGVADTSMTLTATGTLSNLSEGLSGLYFEVTPPAGALQANQWTQSTSILADNLPSGTMYTIRIKARNRLGVETSFSAPVQQSTTGPSTYADCDGNGYFEFEPDAQCFVEVLLEINLNAGSINRMDLNGDLITNASDIQLFVDCALGACP